jgi:hypothetical protein
MIKAKPGDTVGWPPDSPIERWVVVDDLDERILAAASIDSLVVVGPNE